MAEEVAASRGWYNPQWHYDNQPETRAALDLIFSNHFSRDQAGAFAPLGDALLARGDYYMHLAKRLGRRLVEVPLGFKWFVQGLLDGSLGFGGEESSGATFCAARARSGRRIRMGWSPACWRQRSRHGQAKTRASTTKT
jgi:phosphoglucomutase